ncbi:MAG: biopolymer transporter ExbD [Myxococcota bacterium]
MSTPGHSTRRKRKAFVQPFTRPAANINVTPLVDVVLVLLIIFMVVTPLLEKDIAIAVPKTEQVEDPTDIPDEQLLVRLDKAGTIKINDKVVTLAEYESDLRYQMQHRVDSLKVIFLLAEDDASYGKMIEVIDVAKSAGVKTIGMSTGTKP